MSSRFVSPGGNQPETVGELKGCCGATIKLGITSVVVKMMSLMTYDLAQGERLNGKESGIEHRGLRDVRVDWGWWGGGATDSDKLLLLESYLRDMT